MTKTIRYKTSKSKARDILALWITDEDIALGRMRRVPHPEDPDYVLDSVEDELTNVRVTGNDRGFEVHTACPEYDPDVMVSIHFIHKSEAEKKDAGISANLSH